MVTVPGIYNLQGYVVGAPGANPPLPQTQITPNTTITPPVTTTGSLTIEQARQQVEQQYLNNQTDLNNQYNTAKKTLNDSANKASATVRQPLSENEAQVQSQLGILRTQLAQAQKQRDMPMNLVNKADAVANIPVIQKKIDDLEQESELAQSETEANKSNIAKQLEDGLKKIDNSYSQGMSQLEQSRQSAHAQIDQIEQEQQLANLQAQQAFDGSHVKLNNGEYVSKDTFTSLGGNEQQYLLENGVSAFNSRNGQQIFDQMKADGKFANDEIFTGYDPVTGTVTGAKGQDVASKFYNIPSTRDIEYNKTVEEINTAGKFYDIPTFNSPSSPSTPIQTPKSITTDKIVTPDVDFGNPQDVNATPKADVDFGNPEDVNAVRSLNVLQDDFIGPPIPGVEVRSVDIKADLQTQGTPLPEDAVITGVDTSGMVSYNIPNVMAQVPEETMEPLSQDQYNTLKNRATGTRPKQPEIVTPKGFTPASNTQDYNPLDALKSFGSGLLSDIKYGIKYPFGFGAPKETQSQLADAYASGDPNVMFYKGTYGRMVAAVAPGVGPAGELSELGIIGEAEETAQAANIANSVKFNINMDQALAEAETAQGKAILNQYQPTQEQYATLNKAIAGIDVSPSPKLSMQSTDYDTGIIKLNPSKVQELQTEADRIASQGAVRLSTRNYPNAPTGQQSDTIQMSGQDESAWNNPYSGHSQSEIDSINVKMAEINAARNATIAQVSDFPMTDIPIILTPGRTDTMITNPDYLPQQPERPKINATLVQNQDGTLTIKDKQGQVISNINSIIGVNPSDQIKMITNPQFNNAVKIATVELAKNQTIGLTDSQAQALTQTVLANALVQETYPIDMNQLKPIDQLDLSQEEQLMMQQATNTAININAQIKNQYNLRQKQEQQNQQRVKVDRELLNQTDTQTEQQQLPKEEIQEETIVNPEFIRPPIKEEENNNGKETQKLKLDFSKGYTLGKDEKRKKPKWKRSGFAFNQQINFSPQMTKGVVQRPVKQVLTPGMVDKQEEVLSSAVEEQGGEVPIGTHALRDAKRKMVGIDELNNQEFIKQYYKGKYVMEKDKRNLSSLGG